MKEFAPKIIILKNPEEIAEISAKIIAEEINKKPNLVLGLSTGSTMIPLYKKLVSFHAQKKISFKKVKTFNIDEYLDISLNNKNSFYTFLQNNLYSKVDIQKKNINFINCETDNPKKECEDYEKKINSSKNFDLLILGLGVNAHIAFNEPSSSEKSKTRVVNLSDETINYNSRFFNSKKETPKRAITIGISTILKSKKIILLAFGENKKSALEKTLKEKISSEVPASFLRTHKNVTFIVDENAYEK